MSCMFSQGKDVRVNLEYNLTMANVLGHNGWLYNETKALHKEGEILNCSGDSPFQLILLKGVNSDVSCLSKMCLYVPDHPILSQIVPKQQVKKNSEAHKTEKEGKDAIHPSTVDHFTGRRTVLTIDINEQIPKESLMFLKSTFNTCPNVLHMIIRSVEMDLKLHVDSLIISNILAISKLECNITQRNVKPSRFSFEIVDRICKAVTLIFRDAEVIISDCTRTSNYGRMNIPKFEEVYPFKEAHVYKADQANENAPYNVLISLVDDLETSFPKGIGISQRKVADLQFQSLYQLLELLRQRALTDLQSSRDLYETYYQSTICLFGDRVLTPYKLKIDMLLRIIEKGEILAPFNYMTEGTEKSHHTASKNYNSRTMRDGCNDAWSMSSKNLDIRFSFFRAIDLSSSKSKLLQQCPDQITKTYLQICQESIDEPSLDIGRTSDFFRCIHFVVLGTYGHLKETQGSLERKILENVGIVLSNTDIINRSKFSFLSYHYCVLPNSKCIDTLVKNTPGTKETLATKAVYHTTLGNWIYLKAEFITDCVKKNMLMDPKDYTFELDATARAKLRKTRFQNIAPQLQRQSQPLGAGSITYHTAIRKYKIAQKALKKKFNSVD